MTHVLQFLSVVLLAVMSLLHLGEAPVNARQGLIPSPSSTLGMGHLQIADAVCCNERGKCRPCSGTTGIRG